MPKVRPVPIGWKTAPLDMQAVGYRGMIVLHVPVRRDWNAAQRRRVEQRATAAVVEVVQAEEVLLS